MKFVGLGGSGNGVGEFGLVDGLGLFEAFCRSRYRCSSGLGHGKR